MTGRLGFAAKWIDRPDQASGIAADDDCKKYNTGTTTVAWLKRQTRDAAEQRLWDLMKSNIYAAKNLVGKVSTLPDRRKMVRLSSDILPVYTHADFKYFWQQADVRAYAERAFAEVGALARANDVRLSVHPGQYVVLASDNPGIVERSMEEFEYHVDMARWMGYGQKFQDMKINVHISGRQGPEGLRRTYAKLTPEARNCITIENEENSHGLAAVLEIADICPIVLDVHHHWVREGEYIQPDDDRVKRVKDSWRGVQPTMHYSQSREDYLVDHAVGTLPDMAALLAAGYKKAKLRAHSDFMWNTAANDWALTFNQDFCIMVEAKGKNIASDRLYQQALHAQNELSTQP